MLISALRKKMGERRPTDGKGSYCRLGGLGRPLGKSSHDLGVERGQKCKDLEEEHVCRKRKIKSPGGGHQLVSSLSCDRL